MWRLWFVPKPLCDLTNFHLPIGNWITFSYLFKGNTNPYKFVYEIYVLTNIGNYSSFGYKKLTKQ